MANQRTYHVFLSATTTASVENVYPTDYRFCDIPERTLQGSLTSGAGIAVYTRMHPEDDTTEYLHGAFTSASFQTTIETPVAGIRVVKTSAAGTAWVDGLV